MANNPVEFNNNIQAVRNQYNTNAITALTAVGIQSVGNIIEDMNTKYYRRIYVSGDLQRSITYEVDGKSVMIGSNMDYAEEVHNGSSTMQERPYIKDGIIDNQDELQKTMEEYLDDGF